MSVKLKKYQLWLFLSCIWYVFPACQVSRHLGPNEYLLKNKIQIEHKGQLERKELLGSLTTKPNSRFLIPKTYLHFYNFGHALHADSSRFKSFLFKSKKFEGFYTKTANWFKYRIGEAPVLLNYSDLKKDSINLYNYSFANGFLTPSIKYSIDTINTYFSRQKAKVKYEIKEGKPYLIDKIKYVVPDERMLETIQPGNSFLRKGDLYRHTEFAKERNRITQKMRNEGYFSFSQRSVYFEIDTLYSAERGEIASIPVGVEIVIDSLPVRYKIHEILATIRPPNANFSGASEDFIYLQTGKLSSEKRESYSIKHKRYPDSLPISFLVHPRILKDIDFGFISNRISMNVGAYFSQSSARTTQQRLQELGMIQFVLISYDANPDSGKLTVKIDIQLASHYQLKLGFETFTEDITTGSNLPSVGANMSWRNKNVFKRSELFDWKIGGNIGFYSPGGGQGQFREVTYELATDFDLSFPRFLVPFLDKRDFSSLSPLTTINGSLRFENFEEYGRLSSGLKLRYRWNHTPFELKTFSQLTPLAFELIDINIMDSTFQETVNALPAGIQRDYQPHFNTRLTYAFTHTTYGTSIIKPTYFFQGQFEFGGNVARLIDQLTHSSANDSDPNDNLLFDRLAYTQYIKASLEGKIFIPVSRGSEVIFRGLVGASHAYGGALLVPQERRFFGGGTNGMRGWQSNTLGPGTLALEDIVNINTNNISLAAPGGEIVFELNGEYRFDVLSYLELALFTDLGNVWFNQSSVERDNNGGIPEAGVFRKENLKLGWDAGIGFRFDFSFLILRCDIGQQLFAPDKGWVINRKGGTQLNLGIGYPF